MAGVRRALGFAQSSLVAAAAAAVVAGGLEGVVHLGVGLEAAAATGFACLAGVPLGLAIGLALRLIWRAWQPRALVARHTAETGGAPAIAGWIGFGMIAAWLVFAVSYNATWVIGHATRSKTVLSLGSALIAGATAVGVLVASRPAARGLGWLAARIDRAIHRRLGRSLLSPRWIAGWVIGITAAMVVIGWEVTVEPRIGDFDVDPLLYLVLYAVVAAAVTLAWPKLPRQRLVGGGVVTLAAALMVTAVTVRFARPYTMLEIWGEVPLAGGAIDRLWDVQDLRGELDIDVFRPKPVPGAAHPNIVLVTIDTVRADRTPLHGGPAKMPTLTRVGGESAVFAWAFAPGNVTRRSLPTLATGLAPPRVRGRVAGWALRLDPRHVTVAERLRAAGYDTAGFFCCESQFGPRHQLGLIRGLDTLEIEYDGHALTDQLAAWLEKRRATGTDRPLFLWVHYIEPHRWDETYTQKEHGGTQRNRYDMSLADVDQMLAKLVESAWPPALRDRTVLAITSDHGEGLGDRGHKFHSTNLYNSQIRVPLVIGGPGIEPTRFKRAVGLTQLPPTLIELAGFEPPQMPQMDGPSLVPLLRGDIEDDRADGYAYAVMIPDRSNKKRMRALIDGRYKLIERGGGETYELYDFVADPKERKNLATEQPERVEALRKKLAARRAKDAISPF